MPITLKSHFAGLKRGVGPKLRTGKLVTKYWPGGRRSSVSFGVSGFAMGQINSEGPSRAEEFRAPKLSVGQGDRRPAELRRGSAGTLRARKIAAVISVVEALPP